MDNLRLLLTELVAIDNTTEVRLERLETRLGLPEIEEDEDGEWEPLPDLELLAEASGALQEAVKILSAVAGGTYGDDEVARKRAEKTAAQITDLLELITTETE